MCVFHVCVGLRPCLHILPSWQVWDWAQQMRRDAFPFRVSPVSGAHAASALLQSICHYSVNNLIHLHKEGIDFFFVISFFSSSFFLSVTGGKCWVYKIKTSFWWNIPVYCADLKPQSEELQECTKGWSKLQLRASVVFFPPCLMFP